MKYKNKITEINGIKFHSKKEANRYMELKLLQKAGKIRDIELALGNRIRCNGYVIKFGYNSNFTHRGFELYEVMLVQYGGSINDMIVSVHKKYTRDIRSYEDE